MSILKSIWNETGRDWITRVDRLQEFKVVRDYTIFRKSCYAIFEIILLRPEVSEFSWLLPLFFRVRCHSGTSHRGWMPNPRNDEYKVI